MYRRSASSNTPRKSATSATSPQSKRLNLWTASLCLLVCLVLQIELLAYKVFMANSPDEDESVHGVQSVLTGGSDGLLVASSDQQLQHKNKDQPLIQHVPVPSKQPTPVELPAPDLDSLVTYEPTKRVRKFNLHKAIGRTNRNANFWYDFEPEEAEPPSNSTDLPPVIAYVTTLTKCSRKNKGSLDGAAVLLHSIRRNSHGWVSMKQQSTADPSMWPKYGGEGGRYRYKAYVIVDPMASPTIKSESGDCARFMQNIGWTVLHRPPLVPLFGIEPKEGASKTYEELQKAGYVGVNRPKTGDTARPPGEHPNKLRLVMFNDGCCGETELLKLHTYGLVGHPLAVHLDLDSLLLRPMDDLFDVMLQKKNNDEAAKSLAVAKLPLSKPVDFSRPIDAAFTRDYNSVKKPKRNSPVGYQGGFLVVKPSLTVLERYRVILQRGEFLFNPRKGWGKKHGNFYGDATFQGILPYYYEDVAPPGEHNELELDRCVYNQMADNPRRSTHRFPRATPLDPVAMGYRDTEQCRDGRTDCSDTNCQLTDVKDSLTSHFTFCGKPWSCPNGLPGTVAMNTCKGLLKEWYGVRRELEDWWMLPRNESSGDDVTNSQRSFYRLEKTISRVYEKRKGSMQPDMYRGYCDVTQGSYGSFEYFKLMGPDGKVGQAA